MFRAALDAAGPAAAVLRHVRVQDDVLLVGKRKYPLKSFRNVYVIGAGKAGAAMAQAVEKLLGKRITAGYLNVKYGHTARLRHIRLNECGHPVPDDNGVKGAQEIAGLAANAGAGDLVICLVSGGASALLPFPAEPITLAEKQETTRLLLRSGANIAEMNAVRKHISGIKGGRLAALASPATLVSLLLSDVIGNDIAVIGSGITAPDPATFGDALGVLTKYDLTGSVPPAVRSRLTEGAAGRIPETPKEGHPAFQKTQNLIVGSNDLALEAASGAARKMGFRTMILSSLIEGETREVAKVHAAIAKEILRAGRPLRAPACVISGGETTVTIRGEGLGGRNQEFALAAALEIQGLKGVAILSGGTDGSDGPTDAAGAVVDGSSVQDGSKQGLDARAFLQNNDSYHYLDPIGRLIRTGPTNTNVMDVRLVLVNSAP
ncbi:MAG TPA: glycerate kinase [Bryobacteraceae bacterium]|nr:glycerate kinase [Bryobacteraceae bacterium]